MTGPLIVPLNLEAFVVNDDVRCGPGQEFRRPNMSYERLHSFGDASPDLNSVDDMGGAEGSAYYNGVYLSWTLPSALTTGTQNRDGTTSFPLVPNRWLVVRTGGAGAPAAWMVESDAVIPHGTSPVKVSEAGSAYLKSDGTATGRTGVTIGRNWSLAAGGWTEAGAPMYLTAVAPGSPAFATFQPLNNNVFSFVDGLHGVASGTFSYHLLGWYSDPAHDPLAGIASTADFAKAVAGLHWTVADPDQFADTSCYSGSVNGVGWLASGMPASDKPSPATAAQVPWNVAIGNSSVEALTALVAGQSAGDGVDAALFEAFQLDAMGLLDQPDGAAVLAERIHSSFFQRSPGGYRWEVVAGDLGSGKPVPPTAVELAAEATLLDFLNQKEVALHEAERQLRGLQRQLYVLWWKVNTFGNPLLPPKFSLDDTNAQLGVIQKQATTAARTASGLRAALPGGATQQDLDAAVAAFSLKNPAGVVLPSTRKLKRVAREPLALPNNPVVLISGAGSDGILREDRPKTLACRFAGDIVSGLNFEGSAITAATPGVAIASPDLSGIFSATWPSAVAHALLAEWYFTDPGNAAAICAAVLHSSDPATVAALAAAMGNAASMIGTLPDMIRNWTANYWHPLYLLWELDWSPIDHDGARSPAWTYNEGSYSWSGDATAVSQAAIGISGTALLGSHATFNLADRIRKYLDAAPPSEIHRAALQQLLDFVQSKDKWDILSQTLDGFNEALTLRATGAYPNPSSTAVGALIADAATHPPAIGSATGGAGTSFQPWRSGQFLLKQLIVVDRFGQALWLMGGTGQGDPTIFLPAELAAKPSARPTLPGTPVAPPPALVQSARLDFDFVDRAVKEDVYQLKASADPVCGWILPNHLDQAIMLFSPAGAALGEFRAGVVLGGVRSVHWLPSPGSPCSDPASLPAVVPWLGQLLLKVQNAGVTTFSNFMQAIDETLWTTAPIGSKFDPQLANLVGRPLAMVRARLALHFDAAMPPGAGAAYLTPLIADPSWDFLKPAPPAVAGFSFAAELGNLAALEDGLVGYLVDDEQDARFHVVAAAGASDPFLQPIGPGNYLSLATSEAPVYVSMLVDPRAAVHARTAILPTRTLALPPAEVSAALAAMELSFRLGPLVANPPATIASVPTLSLPLSLVGRGTWTFAGGGDPLAVTRSDARARFGPAPAQIWRGSLRLDNGVAPDE